MNHEDLTQLQTLLETAQNILILTGANPTPDGLGASLTLHLSFSKVGKRTNVACPQMPTVGLSHLVGVDKVQNELGGQNLVVSFPYIEGAIEKVSYHIEGGNFNLVIQPRVGGQPLSSEAVQFSRGGLDADLIFILNTQDLRDLAHLYENEQEFYHKVPVVVIDHHPQNKRYGKINLVNPSASSTSELVGLLLEKLGLVLDPDMAHNLLAGIDFATQNFSSPSTSAEAFGVAANCLKAGARRASRSSPREVKISPPVSPKDTKEEEEAPSDWFAPPKIFKGSHLP